jgi:hypothetical protein
MNVFRQQAHGLCFAGAIAILIVNAGKNWVSLFKEMICANYLLHATKTVKLLLI